MVTKTGLRSWGGPHQDLRPVFVPVHGTTAEHECAQKKNYCQIWSDENTTVGALKGPQQGHTLRCRLANGVTMYPRLCGRPMVVLTHTEASGWVFSSKNI